MKIKFTKTIIKNILICLAISALLIFIDQLTKLLAVKYLKIHEGVPFIKGIIEFNLSYNTGFAFGLGNGYQWIWAIFSFVGCLVIAYFFKLCDFKKNLILTIALILLFSGTFGNMIDRIFSSEGVIDFLNPTFIDFAIFNVADSYITIGAVFLAIYVIFIYKEPKKEEQNEENKEVKIDE